MKKLNIMKIIQAVKTHLFLSSFVLLISCGGGVDKDTQAGVTSDSLAKKDSTNQTILVDSVENTNVSFKTITINNQTWMVENLDVVVFSNGDTILEAKSSNDWLSASKNGQAAWCYYNDKDNSTTGKLYNWFAVNDKRGIAPLGWKVPSNSDFEELTKSLGGEKIAGAKLKSTLGWGEKGTNESGFNAIPSGMRQFNAGFSNIDDYSYFWTSTERKGDNAWYFGLGNKAPVAKTFFSQKGNGFSIRCIKE